jgi:putative peptidoglycan lipid II flippase
LAHNNKKLNVKATGVIAIAVMISRVLGLIREVLFNSLFGTASMGLFLIAFRAPNLLRDLFAEGALSTSFITVFSQKIEREGEASAWRLAAKILTLTTVFMSFISLLGVIFAKELIGVLAPGFSAPDAQTTILLTQIMYPFILLVSLAALVMGMLNSRNVFGVPAMASAFFNIGSIIGGTLFGWWMDPTFGERALIGLSIGTLVGGLCQLAVQLPGLRHLGFNFRPDFHWRDRDVKKILLLTIPSVIAASAVQVNVLINSSFASYVGKEAVTWLNSAFRLMQLPIGVFGVAVATITLPVVSRIAANIDKTEFGPTLGKALRLALFLTLPAAVGLWFLADPIIGLIYQHGQFRAYDTAQTAVALQFYALGLVAYSCIKVLAPGFYAIDKKWTPMMVSFGSIILNLSLNYFFVFQLGIGHKSLALSTSISATVNFLTLYVLMRAHSHRLHTRRLFNTLLRCGLAAIALGSVCSYSLSKWTALLGHSQFGVRAIALFGLIAVSGIVYFAVCALLRVEEMQEALAAIKRKLRSN